MQLRSPIAPLEIFRHREQVNPIPPFANPAKSGAPARAPAKAKTELRSNLLEWYHPRETTVNCGNHGYETEEGWATRRWYSWVISGNRLGASNDAQGDRACDLDIRRERRPSSFLRSLLL
jgi:hypothetical protein